MAFVTMRRWKGVPMKRLLMPALVAGLVSATVMAQTSVLDRSLEPDVLGEPVLWVPESIHTGLFAQRVAQAARIPIVFEAVADRGQPQNRPLQRVTLTGVTVRDALEMLVAADPRYHWVESDGVIVVRPAAASTDIENPLNQPVRNVGWDQIVAENAMNRVMAILYGDDPSLPPSAPPFADERTFTVHVESGSVLQVLIATARAHGELMWMVPDTTQGSGRFSLGFRTFEGKGLGLVAPVRP
jgi:hypothetical protein